MKEEVRENRERRGHKKIEDFTKKKEDCSTRVSRMVSHYTTRSRS